MTMASRHSGQIGQSPHGSRCLASADVSAVGSAGSAEQPAVESAMGQADGTAYGPAQESADQPTQEPAQESGDEPAGRVRGRANVRFSSRDPHVMWRLVNRPAASAWCPRASASLAVRPCHDRMGRPPAHLTEATHYWLMYRKTDAAWGGWHAVAEDFARRGC